MLEIQKYICLHLDRYVSYAEYPRDEKKFPGKMEEVYPNYIIGWFLVVTPGTSRRIVEASKVRISALIVVHLFF
jgi:hypothetical protein